RRSQVPADQARRAGLPRLSDATRALPPPNAARPRRTPVGLRVLLSRSRPSPSVLLVRSARSRPLRRPPVSGVPLAIASPVYRRVFSTHLHGFGSAHAIGVVLRHDYIPSA